MQTVSNQIRRALHNSFLESAAKILQVFRREAKQNNRASIFPPISNQFVNKRLKIIQEVCQIDIPLTFHVARHTFTKTIALKNGVPLETVQTILGYSKITTTQLYADEDEEKILHDTADVENKLTLKRNAFVEHSKKILIKESTNINETCCLPLSRKRFLLVICPKAPAKYASSIFQNKT